MTALATKVFDAATLRASDPRYARMIPKWAGSVKMLAGVVLGFTGARPRPRAVSAKQFNFRARRAREVDDLARHRGSLNRDAQITFAIAIASVAGAKDAVTWITQACPALDADELEAIVTDAAFEPRRWTATQFGELLGLTRDERKRLGIRTFRWVGATKRKMKADNRRNNTAYQAAKRAAEKAAHPPKPPSIEQLKPWKVEGMSRRTWYRHKARDAERGTETVSNRVEHICLTKAVPSAQHDVAAAPVGAVPIPSTKSRTGISSAPRTKGGGSRKAKCPASMKAKVLSSSGASSSRGRASAVDGGQARFFPRGLSHAARAAPIFDDVSKIRIPASLRRAPVGAQAGHDVRGL